MHLAHHLGHRLQRLVRRPDDDVHPSPSTFSSESVTSAATSMSASEDSERPVISQSIHTMRSFMSLTL